MEQMWICPKNEVCAKEKKFSHCFKHKHNQNCDREIWCSKKDSACVPVEQASSSLEQPILTPEEINKAELIPVDVLKRIIQEAVALANKDPEEFTINEMKMARKYSHQQIAKAQHTKTARAIFDELTKGCKHSFITINCPECFAALKRRFTEEVNG